MLTVKKTALAVAASGALLFAGAGAASAQAPAHHTPRAASGAAAQGVAAGSPGVLSGNVVQVPINIQINICGNSVNVGGAFNPAIGNTCVNA